MWACHLVVTFNVVDHLFVVVFEFGPITRSLAIYSMSLWAFTLVA